MRAQHSFFVLDVDCVTSLKGLLTYIAERIHLGYMCLFCSKMHRNARRCQQHMMDKGHCFMNVDDEHEYEQYYDFSKTYEGHPDVQRPLITTKVAAEAPKEDAKGEDQEWEDVDVEDESSGEEPSEGYSIITDEKKGEPSQSAFSLADGSSSQPFQVVTSESGGGVGHADGDALSSIKGGETLDGRGTKKGLTREEAILGLKIKPAQLLDTGEVLLGNGRIIGARSLKYIYRQRFRPTDNREAVVVNKLSLEYRRIKAITNGEEAPQFGRISQEVISHQVASWKKQIAKDLKVGMKRGKHIPRPQI
jgi:pre-60S factor REI1